MIPESLKLQEYRQRRGFTQAQAVNEIYALAVARGDRPPGLDPVAMSRHEHGVKHPCPYYVAMYCEIYRATPEQLGLALPDKSGHPEDVDRREFLMGVAGFAASLALPTALALNNPIGYPRNHALYLTRLAEVLVQRRELDEAAAVAQQATVAVAAIDSPRVTRQLQAVTQSLATAA